MNKKIITGLFLCLLLMVLISCSDTTGTVPVGSESTKPVTSQTPGLPERPTTPPAQAIGFPSVSELLCFIRDAGTLLSHYPEASQAKYNEVRKAYQTDGWLFSVHSRSAQPVYDVLLFPRATYEDSGIGYYFSYKETVVQVMIYNAETVAEPTQRTDMESYIERRFGFEGQRIAVINENGIFTEPPLFWESNNENRKNSLWGILDEDHYMVIRADLPKEDIIAFLRTITMDKLYVSEESK